MKLTFKLQAQAAPIFRKMAQEAGLGVNDLGEIAVYALIGSYQRDHGVEQTKIESSQGDIFISHPPPDACLPNS